MIVAQKIKPTEIHQDPTSDSNFAVHFLSAISATN